MAAELHPAAPHHLPLFITAPGDTDVLMVAMGVLLLGAVLVFLVIYRILSRNGVDGGRARSRIPASAREAVGR